MLLKLGSRVDEALESDDAHHTLEVAELELDCRQNVETSRTCEGVALLGRELPTELALGMSPSLGKRTFSRNEKEVPGSNAIRVVRRGIAREGKRNAEFF